MYREKEYEQPSTSGYTRRPQPTYETDPGSERRYAERNRPPEHSESWYQPSPPYQGWNQSQRQQDTGQDQWQSQSPYQPQSQQGYQPQYQQRSQQGYQPQYTQRNQQTNMSQMERQISMALGTLFVLHAVTRRSSASLITAPLGAYLFWRGQSGRSLLYEALNINTAQQSGWQQNRQWQGNGGVQQIPIQQQYDQQQSNRIEIKRAVTIDKPAQELYNYWRKLENLPNFMHHLEQVEQTGDKSFHWKAKIAGGIPVEWDAEIVEDLPGQRIAWRTKPDAQVQQQGVVTFKPATGERGTVVEVDIHYSPPGGIIGEAFGRMLNGVTAQQVKDDIRRFKNLMETGEVPTVEGQPSGRR
ncbi:MAG: SRPBCC family protein [Caldilineaceae bacterium]